MTDYEKLKSIIQEANPEIMELELGCETNVGTFVGKQPDEDEWWFAGTEDVNGERDVSFYEDIKKLKILGRPIRLADVLLALDYNSTSGKLEFGLSSNLFVIVSITHTAIWNLKDDNLDHQSDECKQFLIELLTQN